MPSFEKIDLLDVEDLFAAQIFTSFFCRVNEPSYIKHVKLDILTAIADETNAYDIATELTEYVNDIDEQLARAAVRAVGQISLEVGNACKLKYCQLYGNVKQVLFNEV